jgi:hypothetical protein
VNGLLLSDSERKNHSLIPEKAIFAARKALGQVLDPATLRTGMREKSGSSRSLFPSNAPSSTRLRKSRTGCLTFPRKDTLSSWLGSSRRAGCIPRSTSPAGSKHGKNEPDPGRVPDYDIPVPWAQMKE